MSTSPTLVGKLLPYFSYFVYAQLALFCAAILIGIGIFLSRVLRKQPIEGDPAYTKEKIAMEIHAEITRLRDLRNRIFPGFASDAETVAAVPAAAPAAAAAVGLTPEEREAIQKEAEKKFKEEVDYLRTKNAELEAALKAGGGAPAGASVPQDLADAVAAATKEKVQLEEDAKTLRSKVEILEKTLTEYQIFENDIALVKKYKAENDELRKQLSATPQVTEEDIASLFGAMMPAGGTPAAAVAPDQATAPAPAPAPVAAKPVTLDDMLGNEQASAPQSASKTVFEPAADEDEAPAVTAESSSGLDIDDLLREAASAAGTDAPAAAPAPAAEAVPAAPAAAPPQASDTTTLAGSLEPDDLEALAETDKGSDDQLLAEFQKLLGGDKT